MSQTLHTPIKRLESSQGLALPAYATTQSAGMDLLAAIAQDIVIEPSQRKLIPAGIAIALSEGYEAQIRPRSGLALKNGITVLNSPGTIDADYRGEICVILINLGQENFTVTRGMRIAQMIISPVIQISFKEVDQLPETVRGEGGFGSTGTS
jgi:dUTP pyrophosphatase